MAWVRISDAAGSVEVTCFSEVLKRSRDVLASGANVLVTAELKMEGEAVRITAMDVVQLEQAARRPGPRSASGCGRAQRCRTFATCWRAKAAAEDG